MVHYSQRPHQPVHVYPCAVNDIKTPGVDNAVDKLESSASKSADLHKETAMNLILKTAEKEYGQTGKMVRANPSVVAIQPTQEGQTKLGTFLVLLTSLLNHFAVLSGAGSYEMVNASQQSS